MERYFDVMVFTSAWGPGLSKQHPRGFEFVRSQLHPADGRFIHVGDNPSKDFIGPALRWGTVRIRRPKGLHAAAEAEAGATPDIELVDLCRLEECVQAATLTS